MCSLQGGDSCQECNLGTKDPPRGLCVRCDTDVSVQQQFSHPCLYYAPQSAMHLIY